MILKKKFNRLYVHIPFCFEKCDYCAFYSETKADDTLIQAFFERLSFECQKKVKNCSSLKSIYIGGGTPTYLNANYLAKLFNIIGGIFSIEPNAEITIEANPGSINAEKVNVIASFCNRISIGVQSFNNNLRRIIGRRDSTYDIEEKIGMCQDNNITNISCDLIYAIPSQTLDMLLYDLNMLLDFGIKHLSAYSLTFEENTILSKKIRLNENKYSELEADMWDLIQETLSRSNMHRYEISNYSFYNTECVHNSEIWYGDTYLGCGPAAASFNGVIRTTNPSSIQQWLKGAPPEIDRIPFEYRAKEIFIMGLRTVAGWNEKKLHARTGLSFSDLEKFISDALDAELLDFDNSSENIRCTKKGLSLWNDTALILLQGTECF